MSAKTAKYQTLSIAFRTVLSERIGQIKESPHSEPLFHMATQECTVVEIQQNKVALSSFIDCSQELHDVVLNVPTVSKNALIALDDAFSLRLSKAATKSQQTAWARHEGDKFRSLWSYFLRLCKRSRWSNNFVVLSLKTQYFEKHHAGTPPTTDSQQKVNVINYPSDDDSNEEGVELISSKPPPLPIGDSEAVGAGAEQNGMEARSDEAEPDETTLVNLPPRPAHTAERTRLALTAATPKSE